ncbi:MAG: fasciclin domain-containing protein [Bacteroidetes bacterium]|nr:fasciclin domain-containing protein [Bacteroidota bacterium]
MIKLRNFLPFLMLGLAAFSFASCDDDDDDDMLDIVDTAIADARFTSLVDALTRAGLVSTLQGDGPFTVFAPTNDAFTAFLSANGFASLDDVPVDVLTNILLNHVVSGKVLSTDLSAGYISTLATESTTDNNISALVNLTGGVFINSSEVTQADIETTNGVIHVVSSVIGIPSVVDIALNNGNFSTLVAALTRADLTVDFVGTLSGTGPFTVFAPTNAAFQALLDSDPTWTTINDIPVATLEAVLSYHVVSGANVLSSTLTNGQVVTPLSGGTFTINISGSDVSITTGSAGTANITAVDVQGGNGVVHVVDAVLLP